MNKSGGVDKKVSWSRRRLLSARGLGSASGGILAAVLPEDADPKADRDVLQSHWCLARRAMACEFSVMLPPTLAGVMAAGEAALDEIDAMEVLLSVYHADSAVSYVNQHAADGPVRVDARLFALLARAAELSDQTDGAFDVSAGALIKAWGFFKGPQRVPSEAERRAALAKTGMRHVRLDSDESSVQFDVPGLEINLGSIGKGYAIDRAIRRLCEEFGVECALMQGGRSSVYGLGAPTSDGRGWLVGIQNPLEPARRLATVRLRSRALGTAGATRKWFETDGRRYGHVLDPRTGWPVGGSELMSATAIADDGATADGLATAFFTMGLDKTADFCQNRAEIAALLVLGTESDARTSTLPRVVTFNLPPEDVDLEPGPDRPSAERVAGRPRRAGLNSSH